MGDHHPGWALAAAGQVEDGTTRMRRGLADLEATGGRVRRPYYLALLAEVQIETGRPGGGAKDSRRGDGPRRGTAERWRDADLQRVRGRLLLAISPRAERAAAEAETCFREALATARRQGARALELLAAVDLARLWRDEAKYTEARDLLTPIYGWFTDTPNLKKAKALLDELA